MDRTVFLCRSKTFAWREICLFVHTVLLVIPANQQLRRHLYIFICISQSYSTSIANAIVIKYTFTTATYIILSSALFILLFFAYFLFIQIINSSQIARNLRKIANGSLWLLMSSFIDQFSLVYYISATILITIERHSHLGALNVAPFRNHWYMSNN